MRSQLLALLGLLVAAGSLPGAAAPPAAGSPKALLDRAIAAAGGAEALRRSPALTWEATALVHAGRTIPLIGRWAVQPPDRAVVATWEVLKGEASTRRLIVAGDQGWTEKDGQRTPMPAAMLAHERDQFYIYSVLRLLPLRERGVKLTSVPADTQGRPGLRAVRSGRPDVEVYFDPADGRPSHLRLRVTDPGSGRQVVEDVWLTGLIEGGGIRWPRNLRLTWDGAPYFAMALVSFTPRPRLDDPPTGPP